MKDLYRGLGLAGPTDAVDRIRQALEVGSEDLQMRRSAEYVLLNQRRKRLYDRHYRVLQQIGQLRANFDLTHSPSWNWKEYRDFDVPPSRARSHLTDLYMRGLHP